MRINDWWLREKFNNRDKGIIEVGCLSGDVEQLGETPRAYLLKFFSKAGNCETWMPKSMVKDYDRSKLNKRERKVMSAIEKRIKLFELARKKDISEVNMTQETPAMRMIIRMSGHEIPDELK